MGFKKIWESLDFRNNKIIRAKTDLPTHEDHIIPRKYVDGQTVYNTEKVQLFQHPFQLNWVTAPVNKTLLQLFDDVFFPRILPTYVNPVFKSINITNQSSNIIYIN